MVRGPSIRRYTHSAVVSHRNCLHVSPSTVAIKCAAAPDSAQSSTDAIEEVQIQALSMGVSAKWSLIHDTTSPGRVR